MYYHSSQCLKVNNSTAKIQKKSYNSKCSEKKKTYKHKLPLRMSEKSRIFAGEKS